MKTETMERDMDMEALIWKSTLQQIEAKIKSKIKGLYKTTIDNKTSVTKNFNNAAIHYLERIERLKNRVSKYENKLSLIDELGKFRNETCLLKEADDISISVINCKKNVKLLSEKISNYLDAKISV